MCAQTNIRALYVFTAVGNHLERFHVLYSAIYSLTFINKVTAVKERTCFSSAECSFCHCMVYFIESPTLLRRRTSMHGTHYFPSIKSYRLAYHRFNVPSLLTLFLLYCLPFFSILLERIFRHRVESKDLLVRVFHQYILAFLHFKAHVNNCTDDAPSVGKVQGHLICEISWLVRKNTKNNMVVIVLWVTPRNKTAVKISAVRQVIKNDQKLHTLAS